ncbi:MAG: UDP-N-acetylglucosamine--N-acetylmuramyl-(pentapeptide) pyrophosphoryl-undecaprenol N-acetylglucosamine transferase, partial [Clostridia bacterium]|nr:UDP-N-acetylglucosamine--N-acetylmuramyl-(pentapeptide) pyrophosphoryl-undecaprenol N-acetylglucosamine transferase [Clostridia bacterium]
AAKAHLPASANVVVTGNPLPGDFHQINKQEARARLGLDARPVVLSFGGSLGAAAINCAMTGVLERSVKDGRLQHIHAAGSSGYAAMCDALNASGVPLSENGIDVREYIHDMKDCMAAADLVICRCGAMTLTELQACGKPSILIPSPYVAENHQFHNAQVLVRRDAAMCIEEKDLTAATLWEAIERVTSDPARLVRMGDNAASGAVLDADARILEVIANALETAKN